MLDHAERIIGIYQRHAAQWDQDRGRDLFEKSWLDRFLELLPPGGTVLDLGCGGGEPIARYVIQQGFRLTGVDSSAIMIGLGLRRFPDQTWKVADMRKLSLGRQFDGILAWDSFFHLRPDDQRLMFPIFAAHAAPGAALMFTSGPRAGIAMGSYRGEPLFHASLSPDDYYALLGANGFDVVSFVPDDPDAGGHTIWLARQR